MKSMILRLVLVLVAFTIVPDVLAADNGGGNFFLDAKYGRSFGGQGSSNYNTNHQSIWGWDGGYLWNFDNGHSVGFDVGYMHFGHVADSGGNSGSDSVSANSITAGAHIQLPLDQERAWYFQMRLGLLRATLDDSYTYYFPTTTTGSGSRHETGVYGGLGVGRHITQSFSLALALAYYNAGDNRQNGGQTGLDQDWLGLEAEYRF